MSNLLGPSNAKPEPKPEETIERPEESKFPRLLACILYVCLVSGLGCMLSFYHLIFWDSTEPPHAVVPHKH